MGERKMRFKKMRGAIVGGCDFMMDGIDGEVGKHVYCLDCLMRADNRAKAIATCRLRPCWLTREHAHHAKVTRG